MGVLAGRIYVACDNKDCPVDGRTVHLEQVAPDVVAVPTRLTCVRCGRRMRQVGEIKLGA